MHTTQNSVTDLVNCVGLIVGQITVGKTICVIGSGLAGGIVASKLAAEGHCVTLVERGDAPAPFVPDDEIWKGLEPKAPFTRGTGIGGTSNFWHGGLTVLDKTDVEGVEGWSPDPKSPMSYSDLRKYYDHALSLICDQQTYTLEDIESQPDNKDIDFSINTDVFRLKALLYPVAPFTTTTLIEHAQERHGLKVLSNLEVKRVGFSEGKRATFVEACERQGGTLRKIAADIFILCAGGIGSPKILLESAKSNPRLRQLPIGNFLIDHPTGFVFKAKLRRRMNLRLLFGQPRRGFSLRYGFALKPDQLHLSDYRNHILFLRPAISMKDPLTYDVLKRKLIAYRGRNLKLREIAYLFRHPDLLFEAVNFRYGLFHSTSYVSGLTFAEQLPSDRDRIVCSGNNRFTIEWNISKDDGRSLEKFLRVFLESHSDIFERFTVFPSISERLDSAGHHSGGCRMAARLTEGVVDADLRVFGIENLFVVDGSVLGFTGHANTGLTIAALALKCCNTS
ncbi:MAG: GMC family oxidoreductase [Nitrososphaera sp.]|nr:GMC family oxidoreductase [Nitrososphaera sp.]